nr:testis-expressed protein 33 isoform X2 [Chelonoidis abingdonii]
MEVRVTSASLTPLAAKHEPVLAHDPSVEPGDVNKERVLAGARASGKRISLKSSSRTTWKISKNPTDSRTPMSSPQVKSQASPSAQHLHTRSYSKQSLRSKTPSAWRHLTREEEEARDVSSAKEPAVGQHQRGRTGSLLHLANSTQKEADSVQAYSNGKEPAAGQHRPLGPRVPGSPRKTTKTSHKEAREFRNGLSAKESLASIGQDVKAEGKLFQEKKNSIIPINIKHKFGSSIVDELITEEQVVEEVVTLTHKERGGYFAGGVIGSTAPGGGCFRGRHLGFATGGAGPVTNSILRGTRSSTISCVLSLSPHPDLSLHSLSLSLLALTMKKQRVKVIRDTNSIRGCEAVSQHLPLSQIQTCCKKMRLH